MNKKENVIGQVIRKYRNYHNYPRRVLAEKLNVTETTIFEYEAGNVTPPVEKLKKLHKILDIPFMEFFSDVAPTKGYAANVEEKLIKYNAAAILEKDPQLLEFIKYYGKHYDELKPAKLTALITKIAKIPKAKRKQKFSLIAKYIKE